MASRASANRLARTLLLQSMRHIAIFIEAFFMHRDFGAAPTIFEFGSITDFLQVVVKSRKNVDPNYTFKKLAEELEATSPALLSMVANGSRVPSSKFIGRLARHFAWSAKEQAFAVMLVALGAAKGRRRQKVLAEVRALRDEHQASRAHANLLLGLDWMDFVVLHLVEGADGANEPSLLAGLAMGRISASEIEESLERLVAAGLLLRSGHGLLERSQFLKVAPEGHRAIVSGSFVAYVLGLSDFATSPVKDRVLTFAAPISLGPESWDEVGSLAASFIGRLLSLARGGDGEATSWFAMQICACDKGMSAEERASRSADGPNSNIDVC